MATKVSKNKIDRQIAGELLGELFTQYSDLTALLVKDTQAKTALDGLASLIQSQIASLNLLRSDVQYQTALIQSQIDSLNLLRSDVQYQTALIASTKLVTKNLIDDMVVWNLSTIEGISFFTRPFFIELSMTHNTGSQARVAIAYEDSKTHLFFTFHSLAFNQRIDLPCQQILNLGSLLTMAFNDDGGDPYRQQIAITAEQGKFYFVSFNALARCNIQCTFLEPVNNDAVVNDKLPVGYIGLLFYCTQSTNDVMTFISESANPVLANATTDIEIYEVVPWVINECKLNYK